MPNPFVLFWSQSCRTKFTIARQRVCVNIPRLSRLMIPRFLLSKLKTIDSHVDLNVMRFLSRDSHLHKLPRLVQATASMKSPSSLVTYHPRSARSVRLARFHMCWPAVAFNRISKILKSKHGNEQDLNIITHVKCRVVHWNFLYEDVFSSWKYPRSSRSDHPLPRHLSCFSFLRVISYFFSPDFLFYITVILRFFIFSWQCHYMVRLHTIDALTVLSSVHFSVFMFLWKRPLMRYCKID